MRIGHGGELEVRGPNVFQGYWQDPQATSEVFGGPWPRTGDLGRIDDDGFVYITGRKKELIITAGGKNVVPSVLEDGVREHWLIAECVVVGDRRPHIAVLVVLSWSPSVQAGLCRAAAGSSSHSSGSANRQPGPAGVLRVFRPGRQG